MLWILSHLDNSESVSIYGGERAIPNFEMIFLWDIFSSLKLQFSFYWRQANFSILASHCLLNLVYMGAFVFELKLLSFLWGMSLILGQKKKRVGLPCTSAYFVPNHFLGLRLLRIHECNSFSSLSVQRN